MRVDCSLFHREIVRANRRLPPTHHRGRQTPSCHVTLTYMLGPRWVHDVSRAPVASVRARCPISRPPHAHPQHRCTHRRHHTHTHTHKLAVLKRDQRLSAPEPACSMPHSSHSLPPHSVVAAPHSLVRGLIGGRTTALARRCGTGRPRCWHRYFLPITSRRTSFSTVRVKGKEFLHRKLGQVVQSCCE